MTRRRRRTRIAVACLLVSTTVLPAAACHRVSYGPEYPPITGFRFSAHAAVVGPAADTLRVGVTVVNTARRARVLEISCGSTSARISPVNGRDTRAWDSEAWERWQQAIVYHDPTTGRELRYIGCLGVGELTLAPGDSATPFWRVARVRDVLGDSLPGRYRVTARVGTNGHVVGELSAGDVELRAPRE